MQKIDVSESVATGRLWKWRQ